MLKINEIAKKYRLRTPHCIDHRRGNDAEVVIKSRPRRFKDCHMGDGYSDSVSLYLSMPTQKKLNFMVRRLTNDPGLRVDIILWATREANLRVYEKSIPKVAFLLKMQKTASKGSYKANGRGSI